VSWVRDAVLELDASPSAELQQYFAACSPDPGVEIRERLERLCSQVRQSPHLEAEERLDELEERCNLARRLYYKILLSLLAAEEKRLKQNNFTTLLSQSSFHNSLFACCMEAVFASYKMESMAFPAVLDLLGVKAFDFCKVIESFVRYEPTLPSQLKRHFADVEAMILESLSWADDSPLPQLMHEYDKTNGGAGGDEQPTGSHRAKAALELFLRKVLHLAANRIQEMCCRLLLPSQLVKQVWECLKLVVHQSRHLLLGRHLDQVIMCTIYGVCKVNQRQVTFRHIIEQYKRQAKASPKVFREVRMKTPDDPPQDIICFYNQIFIPATKDMLMRVCCQPPAPPAAAPPSSPSPCGEASRNSSSPQQVTSQREVYISQPRTPSGSTMTPRTRTLYCIGDTPREGGATSALHTINQTVNNPQADGAGMLVNLSASTPQQVTMPAPASGSDESRKRSLENERGMSKGQLRRRLLESGVDRSSSQGSDGASSQGDAGGDQ